MPQELPTVWIIGFIVQLALVFALSRWGAWVARRKGGGAWGYIAWFPWLAFALGLIGAATGIYLLAGSFGAVAHVDASQKATMLAQSISRAMNVSAPLILSSWAVYLTCVVIYLVGTIQRPIGPSPSSQG